MTEYFSLQWRMTLRNLRAFGINPLVGIILSIAAFLLVTVFLYDRTGYAPYIILLATIAAVYPLNEGRRFEFLKTIFTHKNVVRIRIIENLVISIPFLIVLLIKKQFVLAGVLEIMAVGLSFITSRKSSNFVLPTPFGKTPFEFMTGIRRSLLIIVLAYAIAIVSIAIDNFNLGAFALILIFLTGLSFYSQPENEYYVWNYSLTPRKFIFQKIFIAIIHSSLLTAPALLTLMIAFSNIWILLLIQMLGYLALTTIILTKYAAFPNQINIPQFIILILSLQFPPILIFVIPYFHFRALKQLKVYLK
jgi:hypothetical protein